MSRYQIGRDRWTAFTLDGKRTASITCPDCESIAALVDHSIETNGVVTPSVVCPVDGCDFHEMVILVGWGGGK